MAEYAADMIEEEPEESGFFMSEEREESYNAPQRLYKLLQMPNIATELDDNELGVIGKKVIDEFEIDDNSREEWKTKTAKAMELAKQVQKAKNYPWPNAANVKYPVITTASIQFNARSYPAIVQDKNIVKAKVTGADPQGIKATRAQRISEHMSYQLTDEMPEWEQEQDRQLLVLPIVGTDFKKTYFDKEKQRNVSVRISAENLVVNNKAKSLETAPRISEIFTLYPQEVTEKQRFGTYLDIDLPSANSDDDYEPIEFIEQHRMLDLDDDDYPEPYIVTVHRDSAKVVRIVANYRPEDITLVDESKTIRATLLEWLQVGGPNMSIAKIEPIQYYTKFGFIPDPEGGFYDIGLGILLNPLNESINTTLNQLLDAGHLINAGGGFIGRGLRLKRGEHKFRPGEYKSVDVPGDNIRNNIVPLQFPGPSAVLFNLLGMLIDAARDVSSVKEVMSGDGQMAMAQPTTIMALIEQGQMVFNAIYKRIHRSLGKEYKKLYRLNAIYLEEQAYYQVADDQKAIARQDYVIGDYDIQPVSDPNIVTDQQRLSRANFLMQFKGDPMMDQMEINRRVLEAARIEDPQNLIVPPQQPGPDIGMMVEMAKLENERAKISNETKKTNADVIKAIADAAYSLEKAEAERAGPQLDIYRTQLQNMVQMMRVQNERDRFFGMEGAPGNTMGDGGATQGPGGVQGGIGGQSMPNGEIRGSGAVPPMSTV